MEQCLIDNKICSIQNKKCKECSLDDCKRTIEMINKKQKNEDKARLIKLKKQLPEQCQNCSFLEIINLEKGQVRCTYMIKKCVLEIKK